MIETMPPLRILVVATKTPWPPVDGGRLVQSFLRAGLISQITLTLIPILIGDGIRLFGPLDADKDLTLVSSKGFPSGLLKTVYRVR